MRFCVDGDRHQPRRHDDARLRGTSTNEIFPKKPEGDQADDDERQGLRRRHARLRRRRLGVAGHAVQAPVGGLRRRRRQLRDDLRRQGRDLRRQGGRPRQAPARAHQRRLQRANKKPDPIEVFSPLSAVVTCPRRRRPIPARPAAAATPTRGRRRSPAAAAAAAARGSTPPPPRRCSRSAPSRPSSSRARGAQLKLDAVRARPSSSVVLQRVRAGRKRASLQGGGKKGKKCTVLTKVSTPP